MKLRHFRFSRFFVRLQIFVQKNALLLLLSALIITLAILSVKGAETLRQLNVSPANLLGFFQKPETKINNTAGITNFLLLGIRGEGQDSPNLADTIIFVSYNHDNGKTALISVPRDLYVPSTQSKINAAYYYGEQKEIGGGIKLAQASVLEVLGQPVHYTAVITFEMFRELVDLVGGVDLNINPGFTDTQFPIPGKEDVLPLSARYESITFATGSAHLDGDSALKYVRSRHATGDEGTDFARSRRQQQVIDALKEKILRPQFLLNQNSLNSLFSTLNQNLTTNLDPSLYPVLAKMALRAVKNPLLSIPLSTTPDAQGITILTNPPRSQYKGDWVLVPKDNSYSALKKYISNHLSSIR